MKQILGVLSLLVLMSTAVNAQWKCGTVQDEAFMERLTKNVKYANTHETRMGETRWVPVKFHLVAQTDGTGRISDEAVYEQLCIMNAQYDSLEFQFYIDDGFSYLNHTGIFEHTGNFGSAMQSERTKYPLSLNIFITENTFDPGTAGYSNGSLVVVRKDSFSQDDNGTLGHEVGHHFSLSHPHYGWEDEPYTPEQYGEIVTIMSVQSSQSPSVLVEVMDDPDCDTVGDRICDTPPDYGFTQNGNNASVCHNPWEGVVKDRNEVLIYNITNLVMGYNGGCAEIIFTQGQGDAMRADYDQRNDLNKIYIPDTTQITESPEKISPEAFETTDYFDSVVFDWEPVEGAHGYLLRIGGNANISVMTTDTDYEITEFDANSSYSWNVTPINEIGHCVSSPGILFFTGAGSTAVIDIDAVNQFSVHPNPVKNQQFNISIQSEKKLEAHISVYNLSGQAIIANNMHVINKGNNNIPVTLNDAPTGLYHIHIKTEEGILTEKIIVE